ncbi:hypothetical protein, partial [Pseudomonas helleri]|uniref:hypothetical protein n=1 Tax=Pseudomonas helleri TaxID=1608996 RepID=UPI001E5528AF
MSGILAASCKLQAASCKLQAASCKSMGTWAGGSSDDWGFRRVYRLFVAGGCSVFFRAQKQNPCLREQTGISEFNLDDDLLSHGETPHYHRRCIVSL